MPTQTSASPDKSCLGCSTPIAEPRSSLMEGLLVRHPISRSRPQRPVRLPVLTQSYLAPALTRDHPIRAGCNHDQQPRRSPRPLIVRHAGGAHLQEGLEALEVTRHPPTRQERSVADHTTDLLQDLHGRVTGRPTDQQLTVRHPLGNGGAARQFGNASGHHLSGGPRFMISAWTRWRDRLAYDLRTTRGIDALAAAAPRQKVSMNCSHCARERRHDSDTVRQVVISLSRRYWLGRHPTIADPGPLA